MNKESYIFDRNRRRKMLLAIISGGLDNIRHILDIIRHTLVQNYIKIRSK